MQTTRNILLVRPSNFIYNPETATSNSFQQKAREEEALITKNALSEFESFAATLRSKGVNVFVVEDTPYPQKPDAVFPNNWATFHSNGRVVLYPMSAVNRRLERREDIIDALRKDFLIKEVIDLCGHERENRFLEGTGSIVFDHQNKIAYACLSPRTDKELFTHVCGLLEYKPIYFSAYDAGGKEIYHTNVMMCIGDAFSVICMDSITDGQEKKMVSDSLRNTGHQLVEISVDQMNSFAGNMLALQGSGQQQLLVLSQRAFSSLTPAQKRVIGSHAELVPLSIPTIETVGGGSARCMIAEVFLDRKEFRQ